MTLNHIFERLCNIDRDAQTLPSLTGFTSEDGLSLQVCPDPDDPDNLFLHDKAENLLQAFTELHEELLYLAVPTHGENTLQLFPDGRYGYYDERGQEHIFTCGKTLEAKIQDNYGRQRWVCTRIEHNGFDYFLWGHGRIPLSGLAIRERG